MAFLAIALLSGCSVRHRGLTANHNNQSTEVVLSRKNFVVVKTVTGEAEVNYSIRLKQISQGALVAEARKKMVGKADLDGKPRALVNEKIDERIYHNLFITKKIVTVSAQVIEFTE